MRSIRASKNGSTNRAFTLLELIVTIVIIGILAAIATLAYNQIIGNANTSAKTANLKVAADSIAIASSSATGGGSNIDVAFVNGLTGPAGLDLNAADGATAGQVLVTVDANGATNGNGNGGFLCYAANSGPGAQPLSSTAGDAAPGC